MVLSDPGILGVRSMSPDGSKLQDLFKSYPPVNSVRFGKTIFLCRITLSSRNIENHPHPVLLRCCSNWTAAAPTGPYPAVILHCPILHTLSFPALLSGNNVDSSTTAHCPTFLIPSRGEGTMLVLLYYSVQLVFILRNIVPIELMHIAQLSCHLLPHNLKMC